MSPASFGARLSLYVKRPGSTRWVLVSRPLVSVSGAWAASYTPRARGAYQFQVRYAMDDEATIVSRTIKVSSVRSSDDD